MNVLDAAHRIGLEYPGGMTALAARMGQVRDGVLRPMDPAILRSKLNPNSETNHLHVREAVLMQAVAGRADILHAMADALGYVAIPIPDAGEDAPDVAHAISRTCAEFGDYLRRVDEVFKDRKVTPNELKSLEKELTEMIAAAARLQAVIASHGKKGGRA